MKGLKALPPDDRLQLKLGLAAALAIADVAARGLPRDENAMHLERARRERIAEALGYAEAMIATAETITT